MSEAKAKVEIAVLDDNPFAPREALVNHKFRIIELGPDIRSLDQIARYSIIVCDISGVAKAFGSALEGAHLVAEIRKAYPDKFLMAYTGLTYSLPMTNALAAADKRIEKDATIEAWVQTLENGINEVANPRSRWIRLRRALLDRGVELFEVLKLEQAFSKRPAKASVNRGAGAARLGVGGVEEVSTREAWWRPSTRQLRRPQVSRRPSAASTVWRSNGA